MTLSIIIVNYNVYNELKNCINSIYSILSNIDYEIIVTDNNSEKRDIDNITTDFPYVKYIKIDTNLGFAKANNIAHRQSTGKYLLFLNPDTILKEDFISPIIDFIQLDKKYGACAPMLIYEDGSYQSSTGNYVNLTFEIFETFMLINSERSKARRSYFNDLRRIYKVGWLSAACLIIERAVFEKVNGFTEEYFLNYEDIDLCLKLNKSGYHNYYLPEYKCIHIDHKSFDKNYELLVFSRYQSKLIFSKKHYNIIIRIIAWEFNVIGLFLRLILVNFKFKGIERITRKKGYYRALKLYFCLN